MCFIRACKNKMTKRVCPLSEESLESSSGANFSVLYCRQHSQKSTWDMGE